MFTARDFFDLPESLSVFAEFFSADAAPWEWLPQIKKALESFDFPAGPMAPVPAGFHIEGSVYLHPSVKLPPFGAIYGPVYLGAGCELRPGVFVRGNVIAGAGCVLGNSCEFKNCLLLDGVQVPHFNYVGDSILGNKSHLGAGAICSNLRLDQAEVVVQSEAGQRQGSGLRKLGAILGDQAEVGCNAVLNPGSILGKRALVMPTVAFRGTLAANGVAFSREKLEKSTRLD